MSDTQLSEHFALSEFVFSQTAKARGIDNTPSGEIVDSLTKLASVLEKVRSLLGHPININSGYRCEALNKAVGGVWNSAHMYGCAADIECPEFGTPLEVCKFLEPHMKDLGIDQLIYEFEAWTHIGIAINDTDPRMMALTMDQEGTREGFA